MLDDIGRESPDQPHGEHFRLEGPGEFRSGAPVRAVGGPELAGTVNRCRPEQIADLINHLAVRLLSGGQSVDDMREQPHRLVGARQNEFASRYASGFLFWHVGGKPVDLRTIRLTIAQGKCRIPCFGNHPVGTKAVVEFMRKGDKGIGRMRTTRAIGGDPDSTLIDIENRSVKPPAVGFQTPQQHAHEAEAALMKGAHALKPHHLPCWAKGGHRRQVCLYVRVVPFSHLPVQSWRRRNEASSRP